MTEVGPTEPEPNGNEYRVRCPDGQIAGESVYDGWAAWYAQVLDEQLTRCHYCQRTGHVPEQRTVTPWLPLAAPVSSDLDRS